MPHGYGASNSANGGKPAKKKEAIMKKLLVVLALWFAFAGAALAAVNINTATKEELTTLKGIGEKRAQAIIDYRKKNGDFKSVDDLEKVEGIGPGTMKQIRSQLSISGKTTIDKPEKAAKAKGDAMKAEKAKEQVAAKSKSDDKPKAAMEKKTEAKMEKKADTKKAADTKEEKKAEKK
jgi:competence protein ComEA